MRGKRTGVAALVSAAFSAFAVACGDGNPAAPTGELTQDEASFVAAEADRLLDGVLGEVFGQEESSPSGVSTSAVPLSSSSAPVTWTFRFERVRECPAGGRVVVNGAGKFTVDREAQTAEMDVSGQKRYEDCAFARRDADLVLTVRGVLEYTAHRKRVERQLVEAERTVVGRFRIESSDGRVKACTVELRAVYDPEARSVHVTGEVCGRPVDRTRALD